MHAWIGGELRLASGEGSEGKSDAEALWFHEGVARYLAAHVLHQIGLLKPDDALDFTAGLLAVQATSPYRGKTNATVAAAAFGDPMARAHLVAHGALYAERLAALLRARPADVRGLDALLLGLVERVRERPGRRLAEKEWIEAVARELGPEGRESFAKLVTDGHDVALPADALGRCFRSKNGEYATFSMGFDIATTLETSGRTILGLEPNGPATAAGLREGDLLEEAEYREGHPDIPVKLTIVRGASKVAITYSPRGALRPGQVFERVRGIGDSACGNVL